MLTKLDCFPCFLKQTVSALKLNGAAPELSRKIISDVLDIIRSADTSRPPAYTTTFIYRMLRKKLGTDPFRQIKHEYNNIALGLYPALKEKVANSRDPLWTASRLSIAGNIIDFGIFSSIDIESSVSRALMPGIAADDYQEFRKAVQEADDILYLLDNSGEIVFDRILIEQLASSGKKVRAVVKGAPVINDVTFEDARQVNLEDVCEVISNGSDAVGTILELTSPEFQEEFRKAGLIISKGQGNFETLEGAEGRAYFLFQSKCKVVSDALGLETGAMLLKKA